MSQANSFRFILMSFKHIVLVIVLLLLVSCASKEEEDPNAVPEGFLSFVGGPTGLNFYVLEGTPPSVVTDDATFPFSLTLVVEDVGEAPVGPGTENPFFLARLQGIISDHFNITDADRYKTLQYMLRGAKKNFDGTILPGEVTTVSFDDLIFMLKVYPSELFRLMVDLCYDYSTKSTIKVCIKDDIRESLLDANLCMLRSELLPRNSGGPLHVTQADQNPAGANRIQVNFVIENVNEGVFFNREDDSNEFACDFSLNNPDMYKALVVVHPVDPLNYELDCRGLDNTKPGFENVQIAPGAEFGVVRFRRNDVGEEEYDSNAPRSLTCFLEKKTDTSGRIFQEIMNIEIYYRYGEFVDVPVLIQSADSYG